MISFLPGLKSAGGTEEILRNTIGERVLGLPPEPRLDKGIPFTELRAKEKEAATRMNLALSDEQEFLREAARGALSRVKTVEAAREALEGRRRCPTCGRPRVEAGWPGLLISEEHGGAGLGAFDAMLVIAGVRPRARRACRCWACCPPRRARRAAGDDRLQARRRRASSAPRSSRRAPPGDLDGGWTVDPRAASTARRRRARAVDGDAVTLSGRSRGSPTRPAPTCSSSSATDDGRARRGASSRPRDGVASRRHALRRHALARPRDARRRQRRPCWTSARTSSPRPGTWRRR